MNLKKRIWLSYMSLKITFKIIRPLLTLKTFAEFMRVYGLPPILLFGAFIYVAFQYYTNPMVNSISLLIEVFTFVIVVSFIYALTYKHVQAVRLRRRLEMAR